MGPSFLPQPGLGTVVATRGCDLRGEDFLSSSPLSVPIWLVDSNVMRPADYVEGQLASRWSNNLPSGDMLKGQPSSSTVRSGLLWHCKAPSLRRLRTKPAW